MALHRGEYRFRVPLEGRYRYRYWPEWISSKCRRCGALVCFRATTSTRHVEEPTGGWRVQVPSSLQSIRGTSTCTARGYSNRCLDWPADVWYRIAIKGGEAWAWNADFLPVLRAQVAGNRVLVRQLCQTNWHFHYFLAGLPKLALLKRNRVKLLRALDSGLARFSYPKSGGS